LKHRHKACSIVIKAWLAFVLALMTAGIASAQGPAEISRYSTQTSAEGRSISFTDIETVFSESYLIPETGWKRSRAEKIWRPEEMKSHAGIYHAVWARMRFDRAALDQEPLAIYTENNREQIMVFLNGVELFRNFSGKNSNVQSWYRPYLIPVPLNRLRPGINEIVVRADSTYTLGIGRVSIGPNAQMQRAYAYQYFWRITGVVLANGMMLLFGALALLMWLANRREYELLFLATSSALWFVRNLHFHVEMLPMHPFWFNEITIVSLFFATVASAGFCLFFLRVPYRGTIIFALLGFGILLDLTHLIFTLPDLLVYVPAQIITLSMAVLSLVLLRKDNAMDHVMVTVTSVIASFGALHDIGRVANIGWWEGLGFYLQPYIGCVFCLIFLLSFGRRSLRAFANLGELNQSLELRVAEAREELSHNADRLRALEVEKALGSERVRLMREMHDGIGSNLVTALAIAEKQDQSAATVKTLKRAIADLKITVDSLEPVKGDIVALIGNLRHRMAPDLKAAGLATKWEVDLCQPVPWLDATNALHILRIFQEAISNVITHAEASVLRIGCHEEKRNGVAGVAAFVADNGRGFEADPNVTAGKGIASMRARTESMHGQFDLTPETGGGTRMTVWFPYKRP
jgi:signal transduction histidine kinase